MADNFPNLSKKIGIQNLRAPDSPNKMNPKTHNKTYHIKMQKLKIRRES